MSKLRNKAEKNVEKWFEEKINGLDEIFDYKEIKDYKKMRAKRLNQIRIMNNGSLAAMYGYDAINVGGGGRSGNYTVILNRTKMIIKEPEVI